nr:right-handed parallel beta-helix repeat-containing protein [Bacteroidota bacterium]
MKKTLTLLTAILLSIAVFPSTDLSGTISADMTLDLAGSPYIITGNVTVNNAATLTVEAGVEVKFNSGRALYINDGASIVATDALFTSNLVSPASGDWTTIQFNNNGTGTLTDCTVEYGREIGITNGTLILVDTDILDFYNYGFILGYYGTATLDMTGGNITGDNRYYGIYVYAAGTATLSGVSVSGFLRGAYMASNSSLSLVNSNISNNTHEGITCLSNSNLHLDNSIITGNTYPIRLNGPATLTRAGNNDLSGNDVDAIQVYFNSLDQYWYLPSFNEFIGLIGSYYPYYFSYTHFTINAGGGSLEVASDNVLKFITNTGLYVNGTLIADGDEGAGEYVYFTSSKDDNWGGDTNDDGTATVPGSRDWKGIIFNNESDDGTCLIDRCMIRFAGYGNVGAVSTYNASPTINACDVTNSYYGFYFFEDSDPIFSNNTIGSSDLVPIAMSIDADPLFFDTNEFSFSDNQYDAVGILGGTLVTDAALPVRDVIDVPNITYLLLGTITVPETLSLTIHPSVVIKSYNYYHRIVVQGLLTANAYEGLEIVFTSVKDDTYGNPLDTNKDGTQSIPLVGDWSGIVFESTSDPASVLDHCIIKYASLSSTWYNTRYISQGAITLENASPTISNCEIKDVYFGIYSFQSSDPAILNNQFTNAAKTPVALSVASDPTFSGNNFTNPTWTALGIIGEYVGLDGTIKKRDVAGYTNITYLLLEDMTINSGIYVTVEPGVVIKFLNTGIFVRGGFMADGTILIKDAYEEIIFTSLKDDNFGNPMDTNGDGNITAPARGDWKTIRFEETSDDLFNLIRYARVKFNGSNPWGGITFTDAGGL